MLGERREDALNVVAGAGDRARQELQGPHAQIAGYGPIDDVGVGAVVAGAC